MIFSSVFRTTLVVGSEFSVYGVGYTRYLATVFTRRLHTARMQAADNSLYRHNKRYVIPGVGVSLGHPSPVR